MWKPQKITVHRLKVPLVKPYRLAFGTVEHYDTLVTEISDQDGRMGLGEATVLTGYTDETIDDSWRVACEFAESLVTAHPSAIAEDIRQLGVHHPFTATAFGTAFEMLDSNAMPPLMSGHAVPLVGLLGATQEDSIQSEIEELLAAGFRTIKVKVGFDVVQDLRLVKTVQRVLRGRAMIRIDANQGYTAQQGVAFVRALDPQGIELFEQPCPAGDWDSHLTVAKVAEVPLMLDESIYCMADIEKAAALDCATFIKVKLMKLVTSAELVSALARIRELGMRPVLGNGVACDLGCWFEGLVASQHIDNAGEMNGFLKVASPLLAEPLVFRDGALQLRADYVPRLDAKGMARHSVDSVTFASRKSARRRNA